MAANQIDSSIGSQTQANDEQTCRESSLQRKLRLCKQLLMVTGIYVSFVNMAIIFGWSNPASAELGKSSTTIYGGDIALTPSQLDLVGSLSAAGNLPGSWLAGQLGARLGRKKTLFFMLLPSVIGWMLVVLAINPAMILTGRFIAGIYCGFVGVVGAAYGIELADISIRGTVAAMPTLTMDLGFALCISFSLVLRWYEISILAIALTFLSTFVLIFMPESPTYLAVSGRNEEAMSILERLRGPSADIQEELKILHSMNEGMVKKFDLKSLLKVRVLKSIAAVLILFFVQCFSGMAVFILNATRILLEAGSSLDENISTLLIFIVQFITAGISCVIMDRLKRKTFLVLSLCVNTVALIIMGTYIHLTTKTIQEVPANYTSILHYETSELVDNMLIMDKDNSRLPDNNPYAWVPMVCMMIYLMSSSFGIRPIPFILCMEYFPTAIRAQASSICMIGGGILGFLAVQFYSPMQELFTPAGLYWFYAAISGLGIIFSFFCIRETKGKAIG